MPTSAAQSNNLRMYVNDMVALEKHILEAVERQQQDERVQQEPEVKELVDRIHTVLRAHILTMENHAAAVGEQFGSTVKDAVSSVAGVVAGLYDKVRKHPISRLLRDDYTALSLASTAYSMLYTTGLAIRELPIANVALRHLQELTPLIMELSRVIPVAVVKELAQDDPDIDQTILPVAVENIRNAWNPEKVS
ncbi:MAG: hypothetical protein EOP84_02760 [Verrucomicrobiaceae bacterium]|nr:MAG: hypothetical protein EOP84_02760 [Verrucomicrobiaceae bacterium]